MIMKKLFFSILLIFFVINFFYILQPELIVHSPNNYTLEVYSMHGSFNKEPNDEQMEELKYPRYLMPNTIKSWGLSKNKKNDLELRWRFVEKMPDGTYEEVGHPKYSIGDHWSIKYKDIDFCRLDIYVGDDGKIARQEKSGWFCIK